MYNKPKILIVCVALIACNVINVFTQGTMPSNTNIIGQQFNPIQTTVPFLTIAPDSRAGGMGDVGVASEPDAASQHWNPAKYAFIKDKTGGSLSYIPWLRNLGITDINLAYMSGFYKFDSRQTISGSLRYFALGTINFKDEFNNDRGTFNPNEFALDAAYSRLLSDHFSFAVTFRYIRSDFGKAYIQSAGETKAGNSFGGDVSWYYNRDIELSDKKAKFALGMNIANMGAKMYYTEGGTPQFIPTLMRFGGSLKTYLDEYNSIAVNLDLIKYLVPSTPIWTIDSASGTKTVLPGNGLDPNVPILTGMVHSFYDAPGGFREEMQEVMVASGVEYGYADQFFVRGGYFHENMFKGNRKYYTVGFGLKYNVLNLDFAYMIPQGGRNSPLANTMRFSIGFTLGATKKAKR